MVNITGDLDARILAEANARGTEDKALSDRHVCIQKIRNLTDNLFFVKEIKIYILNPVSSIIHKYLSNDRIDGMAAQRQEKMAALTSRTDKQNEDRVADIDGLRTRLAADSAYMEALASKTMGVFFSAYRSDNM